MSKVASSLLPVLALHAYPNKKRDDLEVDVARSGGATPIDTQRGKSERWTTWSRLNFRAAAALSGISINSVRKALSALEAHRLLETYQGTRAHDDAGRRVYYRLDRALFPVPNEPHRHFCASLIYSGIWSLLPTASARHLYLILMCCDPVYHEDGFSKFGETTVYPGEPSDFVLEKRWRHPLSDNRLRTLSGIGRDQLREAKQILLTRSLGTEQRSLVRTGDCWQDDDFYARGPYPADKWYGIDPVVPKLWPWSIEDMNRWLEEADVLEAERVKYWPVRERRRVRKIQFMDSQVGF